LCGQIGIAAEAAENRALALGKDFAHYHTLHDPQRLCQRLQEVTADHLQEIAAEVYNPDTLTTLIYY
jgi:predicted Zn-dependent peptidase